MSTTELVRATEDHLLTRAPENRASAPRVRHWPAWGEAALLGLVLAASAALELVGLDQEGYGNTYYAAAVQSMLASWHNFFFVSSDLAGFVSVDKPPLGLWVQVLSAKLLGFNGVALLLPQALAGIASVGLVYLLVRRCFGPLAAVLAAASLAVMPIAVVTDRNNTMDATLVLVLLLAVWATSRAAETGHLRLLLLGAALVGLAFNIKMLQAYLVLPGLALAYVLFAPRSRRRRLADLLAAGGVLLVVSLAWCVAVDLTPPDLRPYVGSSGTNSAIALALTYNGLGRVTQAVAPWLALLHIAVPLDLDNMPGMAPGIGNPGLFRLLDPQLAGQASWLLGLALAGGVFACAAVRLRPSARRQHIGLAIWAGWLLSCGAYFSFARFYHTYYLIMLGPAIAALVGIGISALWRAYARGEVAGWLLPAVLIGNAILEVHFLRLSLINSGIWGVRLDPWILAATCAGALALVAARLRHVRSAWIGSAVAVAMAGLLLAPTAWSITSVQAGNGGAWLPAAGPGAFGGFGGFPGVGGQGRRGSMAMTFAGTSWDTLSPALVHYLEANQGSATYLAATQTSSYASVLTLLTDQPVMALGGYQGWDQILSTSQLAALVQQGTVRFFLLPGPSSGRGSFTSDGQDATASLTVWVQATCSTVPITGSGQARGASLQLYDCAGAAAVS